MTIVALTLTACTASGPTTSSDKTQLVGNADTTATQTASPAPVVAKTYAVKDVVKISDRTLTVNSVKKTPGSGYSKAKTGKEFVLVNVTIQNTGDKEISYNSYDFKLQDSNGAQDTSTFSTIADDTLNSGTLAMNGKISGTITFEKTLKDPDLQLIYQPNMFIADERIVVKLQ